MFKKIRAYKRVSYHFTYLSNAEAALAMETVSVFLQLAVQLKKMDGKKIDLDVVTTHVVGTLIFEEYLPWGRVRLEYAESAGRACLFAQAAARVRPAYVNGAGRVFPFVQTAEEAQDACRTVHA